MIRFLSILMVLLTISVGSAQQVETADFSYQSANLSKVLADAESAYQIKYSYIDSIVAPKASRLPPVNTRPIRFTAKLRNKVGLRL
jgi:hypothetical protein